MPSSKIGMFLSWDHFTAEYAVKNRDIQDKRCIMLTVGEVIEEDDLYYFIRSVVRDLVDPSTGTQTVHAILKSAIVEYAIVDSQIDVEATLESEGIKVHDKRLVEIIKYDDHRNESNKPE